MAVAVAVAVAVALRGVGHGGPASNLHRGTAPVSRWNAEAAAGDAFSKASDKAIWVLSVLSLGLFVSSRHLCSAGVWEMEVSLFVPCLELMKKAALFFFLIVFDKLWHCDVVDIYGCLQSVWSLIEAIWGPPWGHFGPSWGHFGAARVLGTGVLGGRCRSPQGDRPHFRRRCVFQAF